VTGRFHRNQRVRRPAQQLPDAGMPRGILGASDRTLAHRFGLVHDRHDVLLGSDIDPHEPHRGPP
jgi:hypothetical protein